MLVARYSQGATMASLAQEIGTTGPTIKRVLIRLGVTIRPKGESSRANLAQFQLTTRAFTPEQERELGERYLAGAYVEELAREMCTGPHAVTNALRRQGIPLRDKRDALIHANERRKARGERHPNFRGGRVIDTNGYVLVEIARGDPMWGMAKKRAAYGYDYVLEHRLVMARSIGRPLRPNESVHHINGDRTDNRLENLQLRNGRHGNGQALRCADCGSHNLEPVPLS